ncbi:hypothetical protein IEO_05568 [Bacillus wiedmannii]|nr:hypothetical protein IEO_05568 [Bacillus wiedmannii]
MKNHYNKSVIRWERAFKGELNIEERDVYVRRKYSKASRGTSYY